jgi:tripartite-type tricarboxylate transporter receptor subunit TctC
MEEFMHRLPKVARAFLALAFLIVPAAAFAQAFPSKPVRFVLPFPPGGPSDILGRALAQKLSEQLGQSVVPDNRPGAGGNLGAELVAKSPADGHTLLLSSPSIAISPALYGKLNYDPIKDLAPIARVASIQNIMLVHPSVPAKSLKEFIALARSNPGKLNFGSGGAGTTNHLASEILKSLTKIDMVHVPYKGSNQAMLGLMGGQVDMVVIAVPPAVPQIKAGKVRPLAVLADERVSTLPEVPTAKQAGVANFEVAVWYGILATGGTPREVITRLHAEITKALAAPDVRERLLNAGIDPWPNSPEQFAAFIRSETERYAKVIKSAGVKAN